MPKGVFGFQKGHKLSARKKGSVVQASRLDWKTRVDLFAFKNWGEMKRVLHRAFKAQKMNKAGELIDDLEMQMHAVQVVLDKVLGTPKTDVSVPQNLQVFFNGIPRPQDSEQNQAEIIPGETVQPGTKEED